MKKTLITISIPLLLVALSACDRRDPAAAPAKKADEPLAVVVTQYNEATQLFVEFATLTRGLESSFAAHLTRLTDFKPVSDGKLTIVLSGGGQPEERAEAGVSKTAGIFKPVLKPQHAGKRNLKFLVEAPGLESTHDLGEVLVHADLKSAIAAAPAGEASGGIRFTKEQQWPMDFATAPAARRAVRESVAAMGALRPRAAGEALITAPGAGIVRSGPEGFPQIGQRVLAGQTLAFLVPRLGGETDAASLTLELERTRAEHELAREELSRLQGLLKSEAVAEKRVRDAQTRERIAAAQARAARERHASYQGGGGGIALKSPIAGTVLAVNAAPGAAVPEGQLLAHVADLGRLWLDARVAESDLAKVQAPGGAYFMVDNTPWVLESGENAKLIATGGLIDKDSRTAPVIFEFDNAAGRLRAGMSVRAFVYTGRTVSAVAVPAGAIVDDNGQAVVFVEREGETYERRVVEPGLRDGDWVAIPRGIKEGERVVTRGAYQVRLAATSPAALGEGHAH